MARRRHRTAGMGRWAALETAGWSIGIVAILTLGLSIFYWVYQTDQHAASIDRESFCPKEGPRSSLVVLLDRTDPLSPVQLLSLERQILAWAEAVEPENLFAIYEVGQANEAGIVQPVFRRCHPGTGDDASELDADPDSLRRRYEQEYGSRIRHLLEEMQSDQHADQSLIFEAVQQIAILEFGPGTSASEKQLMIVSDLLQHSSGFSFYKYIPQPDEFIANSFARSISTDLGGVRTQLRLVIRPGQETRQGNPLVQLWIAWISHAGGSVVAYSPL